jgi:hypothetical protein
MTQTGTGKKKKNDYIARNAVYRNVYVDIISSRLPPPKVNVRMKGSPGVLVVVGTTENS